MGFTKFRTPCPASRPSLDPKVVDPKVQGESSSVASTLRSVPLLGSLRPCRHRVSSFRTRSRSPTGVPSRRFEPCSLPCRHGARLCSSTSGLCSAEESVAMRAALPLRARSMLPWALDRLVLDAAARTAPPSRAGRFAWRPEPLRRPSTRTSREGRVFRPCLAPATERAIRPEGRTAFDRGGSGISRRSCLGRIPLRASKWDASGSAPRGGPPRRSLRPKAHGCRRHRDASPKRLVRDPALAPKSGVRWFELVLPILPRSPAYLMVRPLAAHAHARRRARLRATRAHPPSEESGCCVEPRDENPEGLPPCGEPEAPPGGGRPWRLVAPASPASWRAGSGQTVIVFTGTAETRSEDEASPPIRRSGWPTPKRRGCDR